MSPRKAGAGFPWMAGPSQATNDRVEPHNAWNHSLHVARLPAGAAFFSGGASMVVANASRRRIELLILLLAVLFGGNAAFGYGVLHYRAMAAGQEAALRRAETANAELQDALDRMHDRTQRWVQQLGVDNRELQARLSGLEQRIAALPPMAPSAKPPTATGNLPPPARPPTTAEPPTPAAIHGALVGPSGPANFTAPGWVPDYFSNESGAVTEAPPRRERRSHRRESSMRTPFHERHASS
jgi:hypothetical protein